MMKYTADRGAVTLRNQPRLRNVATTLVLLTFPAVASACTVCDSETGQQVRAGIFGADFWSAMLAVLTPFAVTLPAVALVLSALFRGPRRIAAKTEAPPVP